MHPPPAAADYHDSGFYIFPKSTTVKKLEADIFTSPMPVVLAKFRGLNPGLDKIKAGQMIDLSDPANPLCYEAILGVMVALRLYLRDGGADAEDLRKSFLPRD